MKRVELEDQDWNQLLAMLAQAPWHQANPIIMKIGAQLQHQGAPGAGQGRPNGPSPGDEDAQAAQARQRPS